MRIGMIFTGGTIGSEISENGYISTMRETPFLLLTKYQNEVRDDIDFVTEQPYRILSENLQGGHLALLIESVRQMLESGVDGIVVTHGTDTLQYGAAVLGYVFADCKMPIVLVSSNYVLTDTRANGLVNLSYAIRFIEEERVCGVFVSYCNQGERPTIHYATRLISPVCYSDYVGSVEDSWYGRYEEGERFFQNPNAFVSNGDRPLFDGAEKIRLDASSADILCVVPRVGLAYPKLMGTERAVFHGAYHSGTIAVTEELRRFAEEVGKRGLPFYMVGLSSHADAYETVEAYAQLGIIPLCDTAPIAQYCRLWLLLSNGMDLSEGMGHSASFDWNNLLG